MLLVDVKEFLMKTCVVFQTKHGGEIIKCCKTVTGNVCNSLGDEYCNVRDFEKALEYYQKSLSIAKDVGNKVGEGRVYFSLGYVYKSLGDFKKADEYYQQSLSIDKDVGDKVGEGKVYCNLGNVRESLGDLKKADEYYQQSLSIDKDVGDKVGEGKIYCNLGNVRESLGDLKKADEYYQQSLSIIKDVGDKVGEGKLYCNLGNVRYSLGDLKKADEYYQQSLSIAKDVGDKVGEGKVYCNLGNLRYYLGDLKKADEYFQQSLSIIKDVGDKVVEGKLYCNLGNVRYSLGDLKKADEYFQQSLRIDKDVGNKVGKGRAYCNLGNVRYSLGDLKKADEYYQQSLSIIKDVGNKVGEGRVYCNLGNVRESLGDLKKADEYYQQSLSIIKDVGDKVGEGRVYCNLGSVCDSLGDFKKADEYYQQSLSIAKDVGDKVGEGKVYYNLGTVYCSLGDLKKADEYYQQSLSIDKDVGDKVGKGKVYFGLPSTNLKLNLSKAEDCLKSSVEAFNNLRRLLHSQDDWKISLRNAHKNAYNALWAVQLRQSKIVEALLSAERGRGQALMDLMGSQFGQELFQSRSAENIEAMSDISSHISSPTVFLAVGENSINFWVLNKGKEIHFKRKELDENHSKDEATTFLKTWNEKTCEKIRNVQYADELPVQRSEETGPDSKEDALKEMYDMVISPIADVIHGDEIIIVPDGPLALVPYAAVMDKHSRYLSETFRIRLIPSLTSLKLLAECPEEYHCTTGALLVGDPWVSIPLVIDGRFTKLQPLSCAKEEVEMIGKILNTKPLTGKRATKAEVLPRLNSVALVHIAAHGLSTTGEIILSCPKQEDLLLTTKDILNVKLRARLVVLSCCHSGRGEIKAEGVVGMARAFLGAGARSVVVTLWAIDDEATKEFMKYFYHHLSEGQCVSKALNQAMKCLRESDNFSDVTYWAPFVLIGDDVTLDFNQIR